MTVPLLEAYAYKSQCSISLFYNNFHSLVGFMFHYISFTKFAIFALQKRLRLFNLFLKHNITHSMFRTVAYKISCLFSQPNISIVQTNLFYQSSIEIDQILKMFVHLLKKVPVHVNSSESSESSSGMATKPSSVDELGAMESILHDESILLCLLFRTKHWEIKLHLKTKKWSENYSY